MISRLPLTVLVIWVAYLATVQASYFWWATALLALTSIGILAKKGMSPTFKDILTFRGISASLVILAPLLMVLAYYNFNLWGVLTFSRDIVFYDGMTAAALVTLDWLIGGKSD